jgi:hypothetical protein
MIAGGLLFRDNAKCFGVVAPEPISSKTANAGDLIEATLAVETLIEASPNDYLINILI